VRVEEKRSKWEMERGWGGGRFGKRQQWASSGRNYDMYGMGGRFGRNVDRVLAAH
jgi:hypothetical protein